MFSCFLSEIVSDYVAL